MLPSLYVAAASPRFWKPPAAAVAAAVAASCAAETRAAGLNGTSVASAVSLAAASLGEVLLEGVLGPTVGGGGATAGGGCGRGTTLRTLPEEVSGAFLATLDIQDNIQTRARARGSRKKPLFDSHV